MVGRQAAANANVRKICVPAEVICLSAQKRTFRHFAFGPFPDLCAAAKRSLFDHLIGADKKSLRHGDAKRLCGLEVDKHLEFSWLHDRQVGRVFASTVSEGMRGA